MEMKNYLLCLTVLCLILLTSKLAFSVKINRLIVPELVHLGQPTVLDCDYSVNEDEGFVLKWYLNEKLVYQWIPSKRPNTLGILRDRVNLNYSASTDTNSVYRALHIIQPGPDLSGDYTCLVSSFISEDRQTKRMLVFAPGKNLELKQEYKGNGLTKVICSTEGVFPQPSMSLHANNSEVENFELSINKRAGLYNVKIATDVPLLTAAEEFTCELHIPQANYTLRKEAVYYPVRASSPGSSSVT
ncbi:uncharacterized protein LOC123314334 isoform X2 [Coccinella septempunctata]|uniref:uncharacterized protein LOC123314334 isoform X2 n=1 Tax=Coccinella septempunctata TaxID=41139 RepID=UPI001D093C97|nr:uncharacterized protein LOC123314334 isoform X2 [Coccinella septempunctata]